MKIKKKTLRNPIVLGLLLLGVSLVIAVSPVIAGMLIGYFYTCTFKEIMAKKLRLQVLGVWLSIQLTISILLGLIYPFDMKIWIGVALIVYTILAVGVYISLASGGKMHMNVLKKKH
jgi:hypothetical protein